MKFRLETLRDLQSVIKQLAIGLRDLDFLNNFQAFIEDVTISATSEATIRNKLTVKPRYVINLGQTGNGLITKSSSNAWTDTQLYMYNQGGSEVTVKLLFIK